MLITIFCCCHFLEFEECFKNHLATNNVKEFIINNILPKKSIFLENALQIFKKYPEHKELLDKYLILI